MQFPFIREILSQDGYILCIGEQTRYTYNWISLSRLALHHWLFTILYYEAHHYWLLCPTWPQVQEGTAFYLASEGIHYSVWSGKSYHFQDNHLWFSLSSINCYVSALDPNAMCTANLRLPCDNHLYNNKQMPPNHLCLKSICFAVRTQLLYF